MSTPSINEAEIIDYYDHCEVDYSLVWQLDEVMCMHYGYWDDNSRKRAANELTLTEWDTVSKQPHFKYAAVKISKAGDGILHTIKEAVENITGNLKPQEA